MTTDYGIKCILARRFIFNLLLVMMRNVFLAGIIFLLCACASVKETSTQQALQAIVTDNLTHKFEMQKKGIDFYASGYNDEWVLEIGFDKIVKFSSPKNDKKFEVNIQTLGEGLKGSDATYQVANGDGELTIIIKTKDKPFADKDALPFDVSLSFKELNSGKEQAFAGEGEFYGAIRLHDIWVLEQINGEKIDFAPDMQRPYMEIHLDKSQVMGNLGCNTFTSDVYFGREQINFSQLMSTKVACPILNLEQRFAKIMSTKTFNYRFEELQLILENKTDSLIFRKTD